MEKKNYTYINDVRNRGIQDAQKLLISFASQDKKQLSYKLAICFGENYNQRIANKLFSDFAKNKFISIPEIKILPDLILGSINAGYVRQKNEIYVNERFLWDKGNQPQVVAAVLIEEIGHFLDAQLNKDDTPGDEGYIFAQLVHLKAGICDTKTIVLNDEKLTIEPNGFSSWGF